MTRIGMVVLIALAFYLVPKEIWSVVVKGQTRKSAKGIAKKVFEIFFELCGSPGSIAPNQFFEIRPGTRFLADYDFRPYGPGYGTIYGPRTKSAKKECSRSNFENGLAQSIQEILEKLHPEGT